MKRVSPGALIGEMGMRWKTRNIKIQLLKLGKSKGSRARLPKPARLFHFLAV